MDSEGLRRTPPDNSAGLNPDVIPENPHCLSPRRHSGKPKGLIPSDVIPDLIRNPCSCSPTFRAIAFSRAKDRTSNRIFQSRRHHLCRLQGQLQARHPVSHSGHSSAARTQIVTYPPRRISRPLSFLSRIPPGVFLPQP